jgi:putative transposase
MEKYKNKYRNDSTRLKNWDYGSSAFYFVTICTKNRERYFGDIVANHIGAQCNSGVVVGTQHNDGVVVGTQHNDGIVVGTQHNDGIVVGTQHNDGVVVGSQNFASLRATEIGMIANQYWNAIPQHFPFVELDEFIVMPDHIHGILHFNVENRQWTKNIFGPQSRNLASVIRGYKAGVKKYATINNIEFFWQTRFYEHIVRSNSRLNIIRQYIKNNPTQWIKISRNKS